MNAPALTTAAPATPLTVTAPAAPRGEGQAMLNWIAELYPICRSIAGPGLRATLQRIQEHIPIEIHEVPSGTPVLDWTVPQEWHIRDAFIKDASGRRIVDFQSSNLHVLNYSTGFRGQIGWDELRTHLFSLPEHPDWIPYRTSYYAKNWGFCLSHRQYQQMEASPAQTYDVCIDAWHEEGSLSYGELFLPGETEEEVLFSCHACHPSLANDNLSGIAVATQLARRLQSQPRRYGYRFLFIPGTIGAITWLSRNRAGVDRIKHGLVLALLGDEGFSTYKKSRRGDAKIDRAVRLVLRQSKTPYAVRRFEPFGYDERQFCSPGFDLPIGCFMRTPNAKYPQYHTSADDLQLLRADALQDSLDKLSRVVEILEYNRTYTNQIPFGEPQMGRRGLYGAIGGEADPDGLQRGLMWVLNLSDGDHSLVDIAERSGIEMSVVKRAADLLVQNELICETA